MHARSLLLPRADSPKRRELYEIADKLSHQLALTAVERDARGGTPKLERDRLRESGLLTLCVPEQLGGLEAPWPVTLEIVRRLARVDSSVAHVFGFHQLLLTTVRLFGTVEQFQHWATQSVRNREFWGNALNPLDRRTTLEWNGDHGLVQGDKSFCSGALDSDKLVISALEQPSQKLVVGVIDTDRAGVQLFDDWNNLGQRQTDSGSARFDAVRIARADLLTQPGPLGSAYAALRPLLAQLVLSNVYLGIAEGALEAARSFTREHSRAWFASGVERASEDPFVVRAYGEMFTELSAAQALTDLAAQHFADAFDRGTALSYDERGTVAVSVALAKVKTTRVGLEIASRMFEVMGARATHAATRLDRYFRNLRTHTLHDPVDYKLRDLGAYALLDQIPTPSFYS